MPNDRPPPCVLGQVRLPKKVPHAVPRVIKREVAKGVGVRVTLASDVAFCWLRYLRGWWLGIYSTLRVVFAAREVPDVVLWRAGAKSWPTHLTGRPARAARTAFAIHTK